MCGENMDREGDRERISEKKNKQIDNVEQVVGSGGNKNNNNISNINNE